MSSVAAPAQPGNGGGYDGSTSAKGTMEGDRQSQSNSAAPRSMNQQGSPQNLIYSGLVVAVSVALFRAGPWNIVLVLGAASLLLCNPWVRTLLELPPAGSSGKSRSKFDPAEYLLFSKDSVEEDEDTAAPSGRPRGIAAEIGGTAADGKTLSLVNVSAPLRKPMQHLVELVVRDFVRFWYDPISFAHPGFPKAAEDSISHLFASVYLRLGKIRSVDATSELLLTSQSVVLSSLRRKRRRLQATGTTMPPPSFDDMESDLTWPSSTARIQSLRNGVRRLLARNMCGSERASPVVVSLMAELLTKQCWEVVQYISDPDFINQQIVKWGEPASETSLSDKTLSPKELEAVKSAALHSVDDTTGGANAALASTSSHPPVRAPRGLFADEFILPADMGKLTAQDLDDQPVATPRAAERPVTAADGTSSDPFTLLGGFATTAFGSVANAAGRTVNVVGEGISEVGNTLLGPADDEGAERINVPPRSMRLDAPPGHREPPLPESLRASLRQDTAKGGSSVSDGYRIPDSYESSSTAPSAAPRPVPPLPARPLVASPTKVADPAAFPSLEQLLSGQASSYYDAFESFLEDAREPLCRAGEGEAILRLHTQLSTLSTIAQFEALDGRTLQADAGNVLEKALQRLPPDTADTPGETSLRTALERTLDRLSKDPSMSALEWLQADIDSRLRTLYHTFVQRSSAVEAEAPVRGAGAFMAPQQRKQEPVPSAAGPASGIKATPPRTLAYEPRRKNTGPTTSGNAAVAPLSQPPSRPPSVPPRPSPAQARSVSPSQPFARRQASNGGEASTGAGVTSLIDADAAGPSPLVPASNSDKSLAAQPRGATEVMVTDVSNNAGRPVAADVRSFEVMIVVEGISTDGESGDGFVLLRRWSEFEALDADLQRMPRSANPPPRLPSPKGKNSAQLCGEIETYLQALLASSLMDNLAANPAMQRFMDKNRAGAPAEAVRQRGGPAAFFGGIGKNIVSGVGAVGKTAKTGLGLQSSPSPSPAPASRVPLEGGSGAGLRPHPAENATRSITSHPAAIARGGGGGDGGFADGASPFLDSRSSESSGFPSRTASPSMHGASSAAVGAAAQMSAKDLDQILSAIFAVADEAFNLQGSWTLRRGMLRVLEQVVRTTYSGSVVSTFNEAASSLDPESFAAWTESLLETYWPNDVWSTEQWPERTAEERKKTADRAREIIVSYAPAQAGYVLGPGGRAACVEALGAVHEAVTDPVTAADLGLTMTLKVLEMASR